jgi:hypothetical protein
MASHSLRPKRYGHFAVPARTALPQRLLRRDALIIFAKNKEVTEKESILAARARRARGDRDHGDVRVVLVDRAAHDGLGASAATRLGSRRLRVRFA